MDKLIGHENPRIASEPLRPLTSFSSAGSEIINWCQRELQWYPMPWQKQVIIRAHERLPNGSLRFSKVLLIVARQQGKSTLLNYLSLYWIMHGQKLVLGTSTSIDTARLSWENAVEIAEDHPEVFGRIRLRRSSGQYEMRAENGGMYKIVSSNRRGGRGLAVSRLIEDELRETDWEAHAAASSSTLASPEPVIWMASNQGDVRSEVLQHFRAIGMASTDESLCLLEYSAPDGCDIDDREAWRHANPALGHTMTEAALAAQMSQPAEIFRTENLAQYVPALSTLVDLAALQACTDSSATLESARGRWTAGIDCAPDGAHLTLVVAGMVGGHVAIEVAGAWNDASATAQDELAALLARIRPRTLVAAPGPAVAVLGPLLRKQRNFKVATAAECAEAAGGLTELIKSRGVRHNGDALLLAHLSAVTPKRDATGGYTFIRTTGHADAAVAASLAVWSARQTPALVRLRPLGGVSEAAEAG